MRTMIGQINTTPLDFQGNLNQIKDGISKAVREHADVIIFPELSICGYLCADGMYKSRFIRKNLESLYDICRLSINKNLHIVVGYVDKNNRGIGKPFKNMLAVIYNGMIIGTYQKHLLPFYDVFDEPRYFEAGKELLVLHIAGKKCGFTICEDIFNDKGQDDYIYNDNPVNDYKKLGVQYLFNMSSSPYQHGKHAVKQKILKSLSNDFECVIYCNQWGAQDELIFDGNSIAYHNEYPQCDRMSLSDHSYQLHDIRFVFENQFQIVDIETQKTFKPEFYNDQHLLVLAVLGLKEYGEKTGFKDFIIGSSGGIDSAVVIALAAIAFGPEKVHAVMMPSVFSSEGSVTDAMTLHKNLGVNEYKRPIDVYDDISKNIQGLNLYEINKVANENIQARARGQIVMYFANAINGLALTTGNKTELALGYTTIYGDSCGGFNPIGDMYKMQIYQLAKDINEYYGKEIIPNEIINKAPSAELAPDQTDEGSLLPYPILDKIVEYYVEHYIDTWDEFLEKIYNENPWQKITSEVAIGCVRINEEQHDKDVKSLISEINDAKCKYSEMIKKIDGAEFKRRISTICTRLTPKSFGIGRRLSIVKKDLNG